MRAVDELKIRKGTAVTWDEEDAVEKDGRKVEIVPMWKWLLVQRK